VKTHDNQTGRNSIGRDCIAILTLAKCPVGKFPPLTKAMDYTFDISVGSPIFVLTVSRHA
jgi:hypothetical protein